MQPPIPRLVASGRFVALVVALATVAAGCGPTASAPPVASVTPVASVLATRAAPDPAAVAARITPDGLGATLDALAAIATANGGTRRTGGPGDAATVDYLVKELTALGLKLQVDAFDTPVYLEPAASSLHVLLPDMPAFEPGRDFGPLMFSAPGTVTGPAFDLGWDPTATAADGPGCEQTDFAGMPGGAVVLVRPGPCFRRQVVQNAYGVGAAAVVSAIPQAGPGQVRRSTLLDAVEIPALAASRDVGDALAAAAAAGAEVRLTAGGTTETRQVRSVTADIPGADPSRVVMVGAHLDSSMDGPGIDDDGSGVAAVLALARALAGTTPPVTVRVAFWAAEESGLRGSSNYVQGHTRPTGERIVAYLNADMIGSPNGLPFVYDDGGAAQGSGRIRDLLTADLEAAGLEWETIDLTNSSDQTPFAAVGIPTGGLFSGAYEPLSPAQATRFGRTAGQPADACYHLACDGRDNVDPDLMLALARSLARVVVELAQG